MRFMKYALALAVATTLCTSALAADPQYKKIKDIPIGGAGSYDYLNADADGQRLYVSHGTKVVVIDTKEDKVIGEIANTPGVHGFAIAPDLKRGFSSNGQGNNVSIIDLDSKGADGKFDFKEIMKVTTGGNPDWIMYEPKSGEIWTCNGRANTFTAFDAKTGKMVSDGVATGGRPETAQADAQANRVYINIEDKNEVIAVDLKEHKVLSRWPLAPATGPTGMAIVTDLHRLIVGAANSKMVLMDSTNGKVVATLDCGQGVDAASYDPGTHLAFVSAGSSASVTIAKVEADKLTLVQTLTTESRAKTMTVDTKTHKIYLSSPGTGTNGFKVLVYGIDEAAAPKP